jgi:nicotinate dehydrogenase subunit A
LQPMGQGGLPHRLQTAFIEENAGQCGYCLSGIITRAAALLRDHPQPSREQIVAALEKHLCRCGAHERIVRAIEKAST